MNELYKQYSLLYTNILYSVFKWLPQKTISEDENISGGGKTELDTYFKSLPNNLPNTYFGVFTTIRRGQNDKLTNWPEDIHGCIGYWDPDYKPMNTHDLYKHVIDVSYKASHEDDRRNYFKDKPLHLDTTGVVEVDFMRLPLIPINPDTGILSINGEKFDNKKYGLIFDNNMQRATYLPGVFPTNISWSKLKAMLTKKAGNSTSNNKTQGIKWLAYTIDQIKIPVYKSLLDKDFINATGYIEICCLLNYMAVDNLYGPFCNKVDVPYEVSKKGQIITKIEGQSIRNISSIADLVNWYSNCYGKLISYSELVKIYNITIHKYIGATLDKNNIHNIAARLGGYQAMSFVLIYYLNLVKATNKANNYIVERTRNLKICKLIVEYLITAKWETLDQQFEAPEVAKSLAMYVIITQTHNNFKPPLSVINHLHVYITYLLQDNKPSMNIFTINHVSQFWYYMYLLSDNKNISNLGQYLLTEFQREYNKMAKTLSKMETNYLAVAFESICFLDIISKDANMLIKWKLWVELQNRRAAMATNITGNTSTSNWTKWLYPFKYDGTMRLDITGHVYNGLINSIKTTIKST